MVGKEPKAKNAAILFGYFIIYYLFILLSWDIKTIQLISEGNKLDSGLLKTRLGLWEHL